MECGGGAGRPKKVEWTLQTDERTKSKQCTKRRWNLSSANSLRAMTDMQKGDRLNSIKKTAGEFYFYDIP